MELKKPKKHLFICTRQREQGLESCSQKNSSDLVLKLKQEIASRGLAQDIYITSSGCLGFCQKGVTGVLYPQGDFYFEMEKMPLENILELLVQDK